MQDTRPSLQLVPPRKLESEVNSSISSHPSSQNLFNQKRRLWFRKKSGGPATSLFVNETELVDDVKSRMLQKYPNSLQQRIDPADLVLTVPQQSGIRVELQPDELIVNVIDEYFHGDMQMSDALEIGPAIAFWNGSQWGSTSSVHNSVGTPNQNEPKRVGRRSFGISSPPGFPFPNMANGSDNGYHTNVYNYGSSGLGQSNNQGTNPINTTPIQQQQQQTHSAPVGVGIYTPNTVTPISENGRDSRNNSTLNIDEPETTVVLQPGFKSPEPEKLVVESDDIYHYGFDYLEYSKGLPEFNKDTVVPQIKMLIVEDNRINQRILERFLEKKKVKFESAQTGTEALGKWKTGEFHLILMDIQLPEMTGLEATKEIRRLETVNGIGMQDAQPVLNMNPEDKIRKSAGGFRSPVIIVALTASSDSSDLTEALAAGCNDFLTKPVNFAWLERKIIEWGCMQALIDFDGWKSWNVEESDGAK